MIVHHTCKTIPALVIKQRRTEKICVKAGFARINGGAATQELVREGGATVVLKRAKHRIGIDLVAGRCEKTAAIIAGEVVTERADHAGSIENGARVKHGVGKLRYRAVVVDAGPARGSGRVTAKRAVEHVHRRAAGRSTTGVNATAKSGGVAAERAVKDVKRCSADEEALAVDSAAGSGGVTADCTVEDGQRRAAVVTFVADASAVTVHGGVAGKRAVGYPQRRRTVGRIVEDATASAGRRVGRVVPEGAVDHAQRRVVIVYATAIQAGGGTVDDAQTGDPRASPFAHMEDAARMVSIDCQIIWTRTVDAHNFVHDQFAASKRDRLPLERRVEVNRVFVMGVRERLPQ